MKSIESRRGYEIPYAAHIEGNEKKIAIVIHGFASSKESPTVKMLMEEFPKKGIGVMAFDFPAHGESPVDGEFLTVENCVDDLSRIEDFAAEKYPGAEICYFGSSFGAYIEMIYIMERQARGRRAFFRSAAVNMSEYFLELTDDERRALKKDGFFIIDDGTPRPLKVTDKLIEDLRAHDLFKTFAHNGVSMKMIHGSEDEDIAYDRAEAFAYKNGIEMITVAGGDHRLSIPGAPEKVLEEALKFFE